MFTILFDISSRFAALLQGLIDAIANMELKMSQLSDQIAALGTSVDAAVTRVQADIADLKAQIAALQATIDAGGATPEDLAALAALQVKLDALDPTNPQTLVPS